ncbi:unnamed protein product [Somion occarium]|uniref:Uncharacterized protein n=1 Tax=Somion occarium TaxID=3059160 RepID=A0ABP1DVS4_9APHY
MIAACMSQRSSTRASHSVVFPLEDGPRTKIAASASFFAVELESILPLVENRCEEIVFGLITPRQSSPLAMIERM